MSVSGLKTELKFLASIFDKNHERFRILSWKLDELHCQFLVPPPAPPGSPHSPQPPLTLHCNITVRRSAAAPRGRARANWGRPESSDKGESAPRGPGSPGGAGSPLSPASGLAQASLGRLRVWLEGGGGRGDGFGAVGPSRPLSPRPEAKTAAAPALAGSPWPPAAGLLLELRRGGSAPAVV